NSDNTSSILCEPICVPARSTASIKNIPAADVRHKGKRCGTLVKRVKRPVVYPGRITRSDCVVIRWTSHRRALASGCAYTCSGDKARRRLLAPNIREEWAENRPTKRWRRWTDATPLQRA